MADRFQFSLKQLLIAVTVVAVACVLVRDGIIGAALFLFNAGVIGFVVGSLSAAIVVPHHSQKILITGIVGAAGAVLVASAVLLVD